MSTGIAEFDLRSAFSFDVLAGAPEHDGRWLNTKQTAAYINRERGHAERALMLAEYFVEHALAAFGLMAADETVADARVVARGASPAWAARLSRRR